MKGFVILEGMTRTQINETKPLLEVESPLRKVTDDLQKELNLDFLLNENSIARENLIPKKKLVRRNRKSSYSLTKIKARNVLTNISYTRSRTKILIINPSWSIVISFCFLILIHYFSSESFNCKTIGSTSKCDGVR